MPPGGGSLSIPPTLLLRLLSLFFLGLRPEHFRVRIQIDVINMLARQDIIQVAEKLKLEAGSTNPLDMSSQSASIEMTTSVSQTQRPSSSVTPSVRPLELESECRTHTTIELPVAQSVKTLTLANRNLLAANIAAELGCDPSSVTITVREC